MTDTQTTVTPLGKSIVMTDATGPMGSAVVIALLESNTIDILSLLGRRPLEGIN